MRKLVGLTACIALIAALGAPASAQAPRGRGVLFPPGASPYGTSYAEWSGAYQVWYNEIPTPETPYVNADSPFNCELQEGTVVFLGSAGADCAIPAGKAIAFTTFIGFWECSTAEGHGANFRALRRCARHNFARDINPDLLDQRITLDGKKIQHLWNWVFLSPGEIIDFPEDNYWGAEPGPSKSVTKGFFFMLRPLAEGDHKIVARLDHDLAGTYRFVWRLHVEGGYPNR